MFGTLWSVLYNKRDPKLLSSWNSTSSENGKTFHFQNTSSWSVGNRVVNTILSRLFKNVLLASNSKWGLKKKFQHFTYCRYVAFNKRWGFNHHILVLPAFYRACRFGNGLETRIFTPNWSCYCCFGQWQQTCCPCRYHGANDETPWGGQAGENGLLPP